MKKKVKKTEKPRKSTFEDRLNQDCGMTFTPGTGKKIEVELLGDNGQSLSDQPPESLGEGSGKG